MNNSKLKTFYTTRNIFFLSIIFLAVFVFIYTYFFSVMNKKGQSTAVLQSETDRLEAQESQLDQLRINLRTTEADRGKVASYFIGTDNVVPFLETIEDYAKSVGTTVEFDTIDLVKSPNRLDISLTANGSFINLYRFIALIETAPYEISFNSAEIKLNPGAVTDKKNPQSSWEGKVTLSVLSISTKN